MPFAYTVRKDRREERARAESDARKQLEEQRHEVERERERLDTARTRYLDLLGKAMALLEAVLVDADNADDLLWGATEAKSELQGYAQGDLFARFKESQPVVWADSACRRLLGEGLRMAGDARAQRQTGEEARATQGALRRLTMTEIDTTGPRDLFRWASEEAIRRWPRPVATFDDAYWADIAREVAERAGLELPTGLLPQPPSRP